VFALLIGISKFGSDQIRPLEYAHADAIEMARLLKSPRAGGLPAENVMLLTNQQATTAAIRSAIESHLKGHGSNDTVLLFIASHGTAIEIDKRNRGFIVTYDTDPQDLATTAISMDDVRKLFEEELGGVRRLVLYVDVCRAGKIGQIAPDYRATNNVTQRMAADENFFGMLAAQQGQAAVEGLNYGQGHGAFTYFLLRALNGDADLNHDGTVTMNELVDYVHDKVSESTGSRQIPKPIGDIDERRVMAYTALDGIALADYTGPILLASRSDRGLVSAQATAEDKPLSDESSSRQLSSNQLKYGDAAPVLADYEQAIREGRILPAEENSAFKFLRALKSQLPDRDYQQTADKLKVALEDRGQALIVQYLAGEQRPMGPPDFLRGAQYFEAAELLAPDSVFLEGRKVFCEGRVKVFSKDYVGAIESLERAIRLDPDHGYSYNALGIALLEQADYDRAILAFRDAFSRAPFWAYPLHNMALALFEKGDYDSAIRTYQEAMRLAPNFAYLPYNLGLAYQRINRRKDAESMYKKALSISDDALTHNALGYLKFLEGNNAAAEAQYQNALTKSPNLVEASHDYAVLLNRIPSRHAEALERWRSILRDHPDYTPSRLALAKALAATGTHDAEAAAEFQLLVEKNQDYAAARIALAVLEVKLGNPAGALAQLEEVVKREPENSSILEKIGDLESAAGNRAAASKAYQEAMQYSQDNAARRRIGKKEKH
jgi:tetratricopeptide (TPR) repeat protein